MYDSGAFMDYNTFIDDNIDAEHGIWCMLENDNYYLFYLFLIYHCVKVN